MKVVTELMAGIDKTPQIKKKQSVEREQKFLPRILRKNRNIDE